MKLCVVYNVWFDAIELLPYSIKNMRECGVDGVIIIWSEASNYNEVYKNYLPIVEDCHIFQREPIFHHPMDSETDKRNFGLQKARELGYTHFLAADSDEFYEPDQFKKVRNYIETTGVKGIVCASKVYFKKPTLTIGKDRTLIPFIHQIQQGIKHEFNRKYPYAFDKNGICIDPTRTMSITTGVEYTEDVVLHHLSWVRRDIEVKIRNSTARNNIEKSTLRKDYKNADAGLYCQYYQSTLVKCTNMFGVPLNES